MSYSQNKQEYFSIKDLALIYDAHEHTIRNNILHANEDTLKANGFCLRDKRRYIHRERNKVFIFKPFADKLMSCYLDKKDKKYLSEMEEEGMDTRTLVSTVRLLEATIMKLEQRVASLEEAFKSSEEELKQKRPLDRFLQLEQ